MEKYNLYQWDRIEKSEAYEKYVTFISQNNSNTLEEIIDFNLKGE